MCLPDGRCTPCVPPLNEGGVHTAATRPDIPTHSNREDRGVDQEVIEVGHLLFLPSVRGSVDPPSGGSTIDGGVAVLSLCTFES